MSENEVVRFESWASAPAATFIAERSMKFDAFSWRLQPTQNFLAQLSIVFSCLGDKRLALLGRVGECLLE